MKNLLCILTICTLALFSLTFPVNAQDGFIKTYGSSGFDEGTSVAAGNSGDYFICGNTSSFDSSGGSIYLLKIDSLGNHIFSRTYGGDVAYDIPTALVTTFDGGLAICGMTWNYGMGDADAFLLKTDSAGNFEWMKTFGTTIREKAFSLVQTADSGFALTGFAKYDEAFPGVDDKIFLIKTSSSGSLEWFKTYGGNADEQASSIGQTGDGGFILAGYTESYGAGQNDSYIVKTDSAGNIVWAKTFGTSLNEVADGIIQTSDYGFAFAGTCEDCGFGNGDIFVIKIDSSGTVWSRCIGTAAVETAAQIAEASNGELVIAGLTINNGDYDVLCIKLDTAGQLLNSIKIASPTEQSAADLKVANDNGIIITGYSRTDVEPFDVLVIKLSTTLEGGCFVQPYPVQITSTTFSDANGVQLFPKTYVEQAHTPLEFATQSITKDLCEPNSVSATEDYIVAVFPNPFTSLIKVIAKPKGESLSEFILYDSMGRKVIEKQLKEESWIDATKLDNGVFFYQYMENKRILKNGLLVKN